MKLVDASSWIEFLRQRTSEPGLRVKALLASDEAGWCELTLVELWNGARGQMEKRALEELEEEVEVYSIDASVWAKARALARRCRERGITVPTVDIIIAACARNYDVELEHCDGHFDEILPIAATLRQ